MRLRAGINLTMMISHANNNCAFTRSLLKQHFRSFLIFKETDSFYPFTYLNFWTDFWTCFKRQVFGQVLGQIFGQILEQIFLTNFWKDLWTMFGKFGQRTLWTLFKVALIQWALGSISSSDLVTPKVLFDFEKIM